MTVAIDFLKSIPYFANLDSATLETIKRSVFEKSVERGEIILFEGEPLGALYFVVSGVVKVFKTSADGKEQILRLVRPGESFNDAPVFDGKSNLLSAGALGPVALNGLKKSDLARIIREYPQVAENVIGVLSRQVQDMVALVEDLSFKNVTGRVAKILLEHIGDGSTPGPRLTQQEMAAMAGTAREMVGRSLKTLEENRAIRMERHRIIIVDKEALRRLAGVVS